MKYLIILMISIVIGCNITPFRGIKNTSWLCKERSSRLHKGTPISFGSDVCYSLPFASDASTVNYLGGNVCEYKSDGGEFIVKLTITKLDNLIIEHITGKYNTVMLTCTEM